ncbi:MAG TPA: TrkH family potassium uptake protein [Kiritimatiellia bacterium]|nr:TrkH family potassium uptake protein [Kiritimatiellia bacterium]
MNFKPVLHLISFLLMLIAIIMGITSLVSYLMDDPATAWRGMIWSGVITGLIAIVLWASTRTSMELSRREGIGIVVFGWIMAIAFGALPFIICQAVDNPFDAIFESSSGFTTTGASVLADLENHSKAILFWRACTHFLGGMGILVLVVAIIPYLGVGGMQIYRAEVTGPSKDRLTPRIASTAKFLWGVYLLLNMVLIVLLRVGGMDWFDSICHAFSTISTGGFSTRTASIAAFDSIYIETMIIIFMFLSGISFALHFKALRGEPLCYFNDSEVRCYSGLWLILSILIAVDLIRHDTYDITGAIRHSLFYVTSLITTTGFGTVDYDAWPASAKFLIFLLFILGGCAGSTSGGLKQIRISLMLKKMSRVIKSVLTPQAVYTVKHSGQIVHQDVIFSVALYFFVFMATAGLGSIIMSFYCDDIATGISAAFSAVGNIGPGFSTVGPAENYASVPNGGKAVLSFLMLIGRLEFYTVYVVFLANFWRK